MTRECVKSIIALIRLAYPNYYKDCTVEEIKSLIKLWELQFEEYEDKLVLDAVNCVISTNKFPPTIADVKEIIGNYTTDYLDGHDAWTKLRECFYDCYNKEKYEALDEDIKAVFTRQEVIDAGMQSSDNVPFIKNRFLNDYSEHIRKKKELSKLPIKSKQSLLEYKNKLLLKGDTNENLLCMQREEMQEM